MSTVNSNRPNEWVLLVILGLIIIAITIGATLRMADAFSANIPGEGREGLPVIDEHEFGEIFEHNGMLCSEFVARDYELRKAIGLTCLTNGNFLTMAPIVIHPENQQELVGVQARIRREAITKGGW